MLSNKYWFCLILSSIIIFGCAQKRIPPGGPVDKVPPSILEITPDTVNTNIRKLPEIRIKFSEMVNQGSFFNALRIIPPNYEYNIDWLDFDEVALMPENPDTLLNETVILFIGRELTDLRKNELTKSIDLIFSPFDTIPTGQISGKYLGSENPKSLQVWAVANRDSISAFPIRIANIENDNRFSLKYLKNIADYLPVIIEDMGKKNTLEADDKVFLPYRNTTTGEYHFWKPLVKEDRLIPGIEKFLIARQNLISWKMDRIDSRLSFQFVKDDQIIDPQFIYADPSRPDTYFAWWDSLGMDEIEIIWYRDSLKNAERQFVDLSNELEPLVFSMKLQGQINDLLAKDTLKIISSIPIKTSDLGQITFSKNVTGKLRISSPVELEISPDRRWPLNDVFAVNFVYLPLDTLLNFVLKTIHPRDMGKISGKIAERAISDSTVVYITAIDIERKQHYTISTRKANFTIDEIRDGFYKIQAWVDQNNNQIYDVGTLQPFAFPEPFWFSPDTLKVRKRWENRSTVIIF